jgi:hypothetical protein
MVGPARVGQSCNVCLDMLGHPREELSNVFGQCLLRCGPAFLYAELMPFLNVFLYPAAQYECHRARETIARRSQEGRISFFNETMDEESVLLCIEQSVVYVCCYVCVCIVVHLCGFWRCVLIVLISFSYFCVFSSVASSRPLSRFLVFPFFG